MFKFMSKKGITLTLSAVLMMGSLVGCGAKTETKTNGASATPAATTAATASAKPSDTPKTELTGTITASGSSALLPLVKQAATEFMEKNPKVTINVTAGGSGTGIKNVADGTSDIGNSDVEPGAEYKDKGLVDHQVAIAPFAFIVNKDVKVDNVTKQQAADIYMGKITNWKDVGGNDAKIVLVHRPDSSGSRTLVKTIILDGKDFTKDGITQENSGAMKTAVVGQSGSIGYVDTPYIDDTVKALKIDGVAFSEDNIKNGTYKLFGVEHMYTKGEAKDPAKAFIEYMSTKEFQGKQVRDLKFLPADLLKK
ncbi:phosphate ABC transporter substrate-binding protein [Paenibacillus sp. CGMCC 1.16610]|uniref:Phosphate-binding protein n=1 Tax=Paenibacillus anseongense TaxID=2682845 RepID=A0ABW9UCM0_9BACL|nr:MULTISPECIES: phosphate ABC transporter substrate-binding protein [Paenibacillus]MBA2943965.1 phosphate ABC transporter substrate-binding protein [Paenibacillus sp. CGMCC 1.16610]MVQ37854.1 phosphate ABC transporter substrate-binding protein PstS family protein [Paenibacillus anseongense]